METFNNTNLGNWSVQFADDDAYEISNLMKGELNYRKSICKMSLKRHLDYSNKDCRFVSEDKFKKKTAILISGEIRTPNIFINWLKRVKNYAFLYVYTDKSSFAKLNKENRDFLEKITTKLYFSEEDSYYQINIGRESFTPKIYQWLKLKQAIDKCKADWDLKQIRTIFKLRTDIPFLNPYRLENYIKNGFQGIVSKGKMVARSDLLFAFHYLDHEILSSFFDYIFKFYLNSDWIEYPYLPLDPNILLDSKGGTRIEWFDFPYKYIGENPTKYTFFESIAYNFEELLKDYNDFYFKKKMIAVTRKEIFGQLSSVRYQPSSVFASEKCFAHYLASRKIIATHPHQLFSGPILREKPSIKSRIFQKLFKYVR